MEREARFIMMVQTILLFQKCSVESRGGAKTIDALYCLDDACFYANTHSSDLMTKSCPDLARNFVYRWMSNDPEYKRDFRGT